MERKYYIDNLRWLAILLLFPFHAAQIWGGGEYSGFYVYAHTNAVLYVFSTAVYPWYMTFLFAIAGISAKYSLSKRTKKQFIAERTEKLLVPFFFGLIALVPVMTYFAEVFFHGYEDSYFGHYKLFFTKITDLTGYDGGFTPAHLWFLLYLYLISLAGFFVSFLQKKFFPNFKVAEIPYFFIILLFVPQWLCLYILNIGGKSLGQFAALYLCGYYILSKESVLQKLKKFRFASLAICAASGILYVYLYCFKNVRNVGITGLYIFYGWAGILFLLGVGQTKFNFRNSFGEYFTRASFPVYILHMPILVAVGFFVLKLRAGVAGQFFLIVLLSFILTLVVYQIIKEIPGLRFLFGITKNKTH